MACLMLMAPVSCHYFHITSSISLVSWHGFYSAELLHPALSAKSLPIYLANKITILIYPATFNCFFAYKRYYNDSIVTYMHINKLRRLVSVYYKDFKKCLQSC